MPKVNKINWVAERKRALTLIGQRLSEIGTDLPTDLGQLATLQSVLEVRFRPLLVEGGLKVSKSGFQIFVRSDPDMADDLTNCFKEDGTGKSLPVSVAKRARFTIAHELAHTFFFEIGEGSPRPRFSVAKPADARRLEINCNRGASTMLLPLSAMLSAMRSADFFMPEDLASFAARAIVSNKTLVLRFAETKKLPLDCGFLVAVSRNRGQLNIEALWRHPVLEGIRTEAIADAPLSKLIFHPDFVPFGGECSVVETTTPLSTGDALRFEFRCEERVMDPRTRRFFVTGRQIIHS
jgi:hypothetical protein